MVFCHGKKAANSYVVFVAMIFVLSEFLRGGLLTSYNVTVFFFFFKPPWQIIVFTDNLRIIYSKITNSLFYLS